MQYAHILKCPNSYSSPQQIELSQSPHSNVLVVSTTLLNTEQNTTVHRPSVRAVDTVVFQVLKGHQLLQPNITRPTYLMVWLRYCGQRRFRLLCCTCWQCKTSQ